jgi:hypothetical protein
MRRAKVPFLAGAAAASSIGHAPAVEGGRLAR